MSRALDTAALAAFSPGIFRGASPLRLRREPTQQKIPRRMAQPYAPDAPAPRGSSKATTSAFIFRARRTSWNSARIGPGCACRPRVTRSVRTAPVGAAAAAIPERKPGWSEATGRRRRRVAAAYHQPRRGHDSGNSRSRAYFQGFLSTASGIATPTAFRASARSVEQTCRGVTIDPLFN